MTGVQTCALPIFQLLTVVSSSQYTLYRIRDLNNEIVIGTFYAKELQKISITGDDTHKIDKILETRKRGVRREVLVKWVGYPKQFNSWIPYSSLQKI